MPTITHKKRNFWIIESYKLPEQYTVSEWAEEFVQLDPMTSAEPGRYRCSRTPYAKDMMNAFSDPFVRKITLMTASQVGKTTVVLNMIGYCIDQDPAPVLYVLPRDLDIKDMVPDRMVPMIKNSPALSQHLTGIEDDLTQTKIRLKNMLLYTAGANSAAGLAMRAIKNVIMDEKDKYPDFAGKEGSPDKLAEERTKTFPHSKKIVSTSTPTTKDKYIYKDYQSSSKRKFYVPCPHCGYYQVFLMYGIKVPEGERDTEKIRIERLAWYECEKCKGKIYDKNKIKMLQAGIWAPDGVDPNKDPGPWGPYYHEGYWLNAINSPWITFSDVIAEFFEVKEDPPKLMNFINSWLAECWEEKTEVTEEDEVKKLSVEYPEKKCPDGVLTLTAGVDVQKDHFYLVIRGWGFFDVSWLILATKVESWVELESILFKTEYKSLDSKKEPLSVRLACIDSAYRTDEVYSFCRKWYEKTRPIKGQDRLGGLPYRPSKIDRNPRTGQLYKYSVMIYHLDTTYYKDKMSRLVHSKEQKWYLHSNPSDEYIYQFCGEHKVPIRDKKTRRVKREEWQKKTSGRRVDYWDAENYALAAADMINMPRVRPEDFEDPAPRINRKDSWIKKKGSWIKR